MQTPQQNGVQSEGRDVVHIDHFMVHVQRFGQTEWRVTEPHAEIGAALRECLMYQAKGDHAFITGRNEAGEVQIVIPVADYPAAGVTSLSTGIYGAPDEHTFDAVDTFAEKMAWTV